MTNIDFYILNSEQLEERYKFVAKLAQKIYHNRLKLYIHTQQPQQQTYLDDVLWDFHPASFLPHELWHDQQVEASPSDQEYPILIGVNGSKTVTPPPPFDVLINLSDDIPVFFSRYQRVLEVVSLDAHTKTQTRAHYKYYKDRGYPLKNHDLRKSQA